MQLQNSLLAPITRRQLWAALVLERGVVTLVEAARRADIETIPDPPTTLSAPPDVVDFGDRELDVEQQAKMLDGAADHFGAVYGGADEICVFLIRRYP